VLVIGDKLGVDKFSGSVGVKIVAHVAALRLHVSAQLVKGRGGDQVALAVDLPSERRVCRADFVVAAGSGGGSSVLGDFSSHFAVNDHSAHEVRVEVVFVVNNGKDLGLNTDLELDSGKVTKNLNAA